MSTMDLSVVYEMVLGISDTAAALRPTPHWDSVSKVRLSRATTDCGGVVTVWVPLLSVISMLDSAAALWVAGDVSLPAPDEQAVSPPASRAADRATTARVPRFVNRVDDIGLSSENGEGTWCFVSGSLHSPPTGGTHIR